LGPGLDARDIRIFGSARGFAAVFAFTGLQATLLLLLLAFLLRFFARAFMSSGARVSWHQVYSLPALLAAAPAAAITTATATEAPAAATAFAGCFRTRFIHSDRAAFKVCPVELVDGISSFLFIRHLDEAKALASPCVSIGDDRGGFNFARL
jgi:hypothetical protein